MLTWLALQAFDSSCAPSTQQFSYPAAVKSWTAAKFPANKVRCSSPVPVRWVLRDEGEQREPSSLTFTSCARADHARPRLVRLRLEGALTSRSLSPIAVLLALSSPC